MTVGAQVKSCYASIKGIEASLRILRSQTNDLEAHDAYLETEHIIQEIKKDLEEQVLLLARQEPQYNQ
ncbi:DUF1657 domain-containing protein [Ornithinibacillus bavariensis]|uniref:NADH dehydrogenase n=1 Tax=Ornithinibacillus bavariensis TaxID=545502 RepID=A0A920C4T6_9BACI|nr:DUF1657 domain-containing protein [Ornithinibacillus bavariensis]GIO25975.1 NADH dehydrogenase [Ornithinibacillus bavariensis]